MENKNIVNYLIALFKIDNPYLINDLIEDVDNLENKELLIPFIKEKMNYEKFKFLNSFEKLTSIINEFRKDHKLKLSDDMEDKALSYSDNLYKRVTTILDEVNFVLQAKGKKIEDLKLNETFKKNGLENHHISVLNSVGDKKKLMSLCLYSKEELRLRIEDIVNKKALAKQYPQLVAKSDDKKLIERLKDAN